jgi:L-ascorbate metabolism protein UlaG (beta-lactamase superfamily)
MDPSAAARAVELLAVQTVIPIHFGTFPILAGTPEALRTELGRLGLDSVRVVTPEPGVPIS